MKVGLGRVADSTKVTDCNVGETRTPPKSLLK